MEQSDSKEVKNKEKIAKELESLAMQQFSESINVVVYKHFKGKAQALADKIGVSKTSMSLYSNGKRLPPYNILYRLYRLGFSIDFLMSGVEPIMLGGLPSVDVAEGVYEGTVADIEIKDDKMANTLNHGSIATVQTVDAKDVEVGGIYSVEKQIGGRFIARLVSEGSWVYDNTAYKPFEYNVSEKDKVSKLIKVINYSFPTQ